MTDQPKHTPGPWKICWNGDSTAFDNEPFAYALDVGPGRTTSICRVRHGACDDEYGGKDAIKANANLIAAAPDMLEALKNLENDDGKAMPPSAWALVQNAIAKAEGRS